MLLLTSASTAVKLEHCDANLRRCSYPGEEAGSVRLRRRGEKKRKKDKECVCVREAGRETERDGEKETIRRRDKKCVREGGIGKETTLAR